jgi:hypothetical protein
MNNLTERKTDAPGLKAAMLDAVALKFTKTTQDKKI